MTDRRGTVEEATRDLVALSMPEASKETLDEVAAEIALKIRESIEEVSGQDAVMRERLISCSSVRR